MNILPRPRGLQILKMLSKVRQNYSEAYQELHQTYGDMVGIDLPFKAILIFKPEHIRHILKDNARNYHKSNLYDTLSPILGKGLVTSEGALWKKQRRIVAPEFHIKSIQSYLDGMTSRTLILAKEWEKLASTSPTGSYHDISTAMMGLTFKIVGDTLFGSDLGDEAIEVKDALYTVLHLATERMMSIVKFPRSWPTPSNLKTRQASEKLQGVVRTIIAKRIESQMKDGQPMKMDVLTRLLTAHQSEDSDQMSDQQLIDEINTIILAGHETTSQTLSWTWYLLARNPEVEKKLQAELQTVLQGRVPSMEDISKLHYTKMVLKEAMRLYPPIPVISRTPIQDDQLDGIHIPAGIVVSLCPYVVHRDPKLWNNPEVFDPERFSPANEKAIKDYSYFPFSAGPRSCIGEHFAMTESILILAILSSQFRLTLRPGAEVKIKSSITLSPLGGLPMTIEKREQVKVRHFEMKPRDPTLSLESQSFV
ncbi:MAG: cytochrome P450 [Bdellovibrionia bacterium]